MSNSAFYKIFFLLLFVFPVGLFAKTTEKQIKTFTVPVEFSASPDSVPRTRVPVKKPDEEKTKGRKPEIKKPDTKKPAVRKPNIKSVPQAKPKLKPIVPGKGAKPVKVLKIQRAVHLNLRN